jgi:SAM-dependent methyltransferase
VSTGSAEYHEQNLLDRLSPPERLEAQYAHMLERERLILRRRLPLPGGRVLSVGAGWHPGRHLFPAPAFTLHAVDADPARVAGVLGSGRADSAAVGLAGALELPPAGFDVVLYRLVLHHLIFQGPLQPVFQEAARLLRPGGALVAIEPGLWHPVGAGLALTNRLRLGTAVHGTPDDVPLSPRALVELARDAGLHAELHAVSFGWRRLPVGVNRLLWRLDALGSRPRAAPFGHTLLLLARRCG